MRTCVLVWPLRPYNARIELDGALDHGPLEHAVILAAEVGEDTGQQLDLATALRFLPLVASQQPEQFDAWALRWLRRWIDEVSGTAIEKAAVVSAALADLPADLACLETIRVSLAR